MRKHNSVICVAIVLMLSFGSQCLAAGQGRLQMVQMQFFGKVVDQFGQPVRDAAVHIQVSGPDENPLRGIKALSIKTNPNGLFTIHERGVGFEVKTIKRSGYELVQAGNQDRKLKYSSHVPSEVFVPGASNPVTFTLRKKGDPAAVVTRLHAFSLRPESTGPYDLDLVNGGVDFSMRFPFSGHPAPVRMPELPQEEFQEHKDLGISGVFSGETSSWSINITALDEGGGVIASDSFAKDAPLEGYSSNVTIEVGVLKPNARDNKYLFVKSRAGGLYGLLELELVSHDKGLGISMTSWANLTGSTILEIDKTMRPMETRRSLSTTERRPAGRSRRSTGMVSRQQPRGIRKKSK